MSNTVSGVIIGGLLTAAVIWFIIWRNHRKRKKERKLRIVKIEKESYAASALLNCGKRPK